MAHDPVDKPAHYQADNFECIDVIEHILTPEQFTGYLLGNVLKYMYRHGYKGNPVQDLEKAYWYLSKHQAVGKAPTPEKTTHQQKCGCAECVWLRVKRMVGANL